MEHIRLQLGDITEATVDAIVNAANSRLLGGGGVDGAIHRAAGPSLLEACRELPEHNGVRCPTGEARITHAGELAAKYVIHTVGPVYHSDPQPAKHLESAYDNSFRLALENSCRTLAVPAISCGVYGYPLREAAEIALKTSDRPRYRTLDITFYLFGDELFSIWQAVYEELH